MYWLSSGAAAVVYGYDGAGMPAIYGRIEDGSKDGTGRNDNGYYGFAGTYRCEGSSCKESVKGLSAEGRSGTGAGWQSGDTYTG